jgi:hypothetical protein
VRSGLKALDQTLPRGGLPVGAVTEILCGAAGVGATTLALSVARRAANGSRTVVVIDAHDDFYPPAAARLGIPIERFLVIRSRRTADTVWAMDQSLRCPAVGAVIAELDGLKPGESRRLQLAAETGGTVGLVIRPRLVCERTFAAVRIALEPVPVDESAVRGNGVRRVRISVLKVREGMPVEPFLVGLDDEEGFVSLPSVALAGSPRARGRRVGA